MWHTDTTHLGCPYCGERIELVIDPSEPEQTYVEDCQVCCRPMIVTVSANADGGFEVTASRDDD